MSQREGNSSIEEIDKGNGHIESDNDYLRLRKLLLGDDYSSALQRYVSKEEELQRVSEVLPEAIKLTTQAELCDALSPVVDQAIEKSIEQNPTRITHVLFPIMGPSIRKAVASALAEMVQSLNNLLEKSLTLGSLNWRVRAWRAGMPYAQYVLLQTTQYRVEQVLLVHRETGLLLNSVAAPEVEIQDPELVSSMLTAIGDFVSDSFSAGDETLERVRLGDFEIHLNVGPHAILALAVRGSASDELTLKANTTIETIHAQFSHQLSHFEGDRAPFDETTPALSECLLSQKVQAREKRKPWMAIILIGCAIVYGVISSVKLWQIERQYSVLEHLINNEPGYIVLSAEPKESVLHVKVIRSPDSRQAGIVTVDLLNQLEKESRADWLSSKMVDLQVSDTVVHMGPMPVIEPVKLDVVQESLSDLDEFKLLVEQVRNTVFYFEPNQSILSGDELLKIPKVVKTINSLETKAADMGVPDLQILVMGFADSIGSSFGSNTVSQQRADGVRSMLTENAVSADITVAWGAGNVDLDRISDKAQRRVTLQVLYSHKEQGAHHLEGLDEALEEAQEPRLESAAEEESDMDINSGDTGE
ncbi:OmpA family protein [Alkalimarinus alittae]|uniref:OmpA family protein n=1 Tax=Alkalimarinus alittae TaxID=2961619 RepID=A0ABY6N4I8_9ALTE|nr:OmpA family protein [Alkalimarinus alittae]UZE96907.1 OmpA family protein [Alkalimarinus alittae]